ncbi:MAG: hypothetical protein HZA28_01410 [Candidatus Omnitrophica bacterium]|nr:hypothetical protein [Candidatus Omnitrophota bacterium]
MNFLEFKTIFENHSVIDARDIVTYFDRIDRRRLYEWQKKGYILKIINNFYIMSGKSINDQVLRNIACRIYQPSYIGLESALAYYNFIPEAVFQIVGITTRRNKTVRTQIGDFRYCSIKNSLFFGYDAVEAGNDRFFISDPEKTLLDFLYFSPFSDKKEVLEAMRLNIEEIGRLVNVVKMRNYLKIFSSRKLNKAVRLLMEAMDVKF